MSKSPFSTAPVVERGAERPPAPIPTITPPPHAGHARHAGRRWLVIGSLVAMVALGAGMGALAVAQYIGQPAPAPIARATATSTGVAVPGPRACPASAVDPARWLPLINSYVPGSDLTGARVACGGLLDDTSTQALVTAHRSDGKLNVYVYTNIFSQAPRLLLQMGGLLMGDAKICAPGTVLTAEADQTSRANANKPISAMTADLYREFAWSPSAGQFTQTVFPGLFPDLTRYQAEADQAVVAQGQQPWKLDAGQVTIALAARLLQWPASTCVATALSGGGPGDLSARIAVTSSLGGGLDSVTMTLQRLNNRTDGIWEVTSATSEVATITSPAPLSLLTSPVAAAGATNAFEGYGGQMSVLDHLYTPLGAAHVTVSQGMGRATYTARVPFTTGWTDTQEGALILTRNSEVDDSLATMVLVKALINGSSAG